MLQAYRSIATRDPLSGKELDRYDVRLLAFRRLDTSSEENLAAAYAAEADVVLRNREWIILRRHSPGM
jgi:hypothetical protein